MKSEISAPARSFTVRLSATRRGARLARRLVLTQLDLWGFPYATSLSEAAETVTAELAANAVTHGRTPGRDIRLALTLSRTHTAHILRIAVSDTRPDHLPPDPATLTAPSTETPGGRGLFLVDALATRWGCTVHDHLVKTVWAELAHSRSQEKVLDVSHWSVNHLPVT
ncbi:ATP-binding protein [Streptomyces sp. NBC_00444]|uniref:ATP-binding protein n=1 Tax=Streptomyces sp. NBC_00444 TaxID=2975744 RepID=UPI002E1CF731